MSREVDDLEPENGRLNGLYGDLEPSPAMENRVVAALTEARLLESDPATRGSSESPSEASPNGHIHAGRMLWRVAASAALVGMGWAAGANGIGREATPRDGAGAQASSGEVAQVTAPAAAAGPRFMLLLYEPDDFQAAGTDPQDDVIDEYRDWATDLANAGTFVQGERLGSNGSLVMPERDATPNAARVLALPLGDPVLGGYFVIDAPSLAEAVRLAEGHPHRKYGGWIAVREIAPT